MGKNNSNSTRECQECSFQLIAGFVGAFLKKSLNNIIPPWGRLGRPISYFWIISLTLAERVQKITKLTILSNNNHNLTCLYVIFYDTDVPTHSVKGTYHQHAFRPCCMLEDLSAHTSSETNKIIFSSFVHSIWHAGTVSVLRIGKILWLITMISYWNLNISLSDYLFNFW